jgi:hypothetical protein
MPQITYSKKLRYPDAKRPRQLLDIVDRNIPRFSFYVGNEGSI